MSFRHDPTFPNMLARSIAIPRLLPQTPPAQPPPTPTSMGQTCLATLACRRRQGALQWPGGTLNVIVAEARREARGGTRWSKADSRKHRQHSKRVRRLRGLIGGMSNVSNARTGLPSSSRKRVSKSRRELWPIYFWHVRGTLGTWYVITGHGRNPRFCCTVPTSRRKLAPAVIQCRSSFLLGCEGQPTQHRFSPRVAVATPVFPKQFWIPERPTLVGLQNET